MDTPATVPGARRAALALGALGVVFGDIGTSPLYTLQMATGEHGTNPSSDNILGVCSLIFWGLTLVVAIKYLTFILRADNRGEGGILALLALIPERVQARGAGWVALMVLAGAALLFGDGVITPAISVLSAIEGLDLAAPGAFPLPAIVAITVVILVILFAVQRRGTGSLGAIFGPVMTLWFVTIGVLGLVQVVQHPVIFEALSPVHAVRFFLRNGWHGFPILGVVVLCLTGGEALYADMGHFGARLIRLAWFALAMPALVLCYFGQGALMITDRSALANPFFSLVPPGAPMIALVVLATAATIIASQALITGVFSLTHQAVSLGYFPRVTIKHTSHETEGQIYVPELNWGLAIGCILLVVTFRESSALAAAFGLAVSGTMGITSIAYYLVTRRTWGWPRWKALPLLILFLSFDLPFLAANLLKFAEGGYVPVALGALLFLMMVIWNRGRRALKLAFEARSAPLGAFIDGVGARLAARVPGTGVFMASAVGTVPPALERHVARIHVLHAHVILLTVVFEHVPSVTEPERLEVEQLANGFVRVVAHYGYMETPDVPGLLGEVERRLGCPLELDHATYYVGRETFLGTAKGEMGPVTERLFAFLSRNAKSATSFFAIPPDQVIELGTQLDL